MGNIMRIFRSSSELIEAMGNHLGYSDWIVVDQERIDLFAEATGDKQWIHVDPVSYTHLTLPTIYSV